MEGKGTNMNPYVYKRKRLSLSSSNSVKTVSLTNLVKEVFSGQISSAIAFAAIAFGAMSVLTLSLTTEAEIGRLYGQAPVFESQMVKRTAMQVRSFAQITENRPSLVLGETTYPEFSITSVGNKTISIKGQPVEYYPSTGNWMYSISWNRKKNATGSLYVNGQGVADYANQSGFIKAELKAGSRAKVEFYSQANKKGTLLVRKYFTVKDSVGDTTSCTSVKLETCEDGSIPTVNVGNCEYKCSGKPICPMMMCAAPPEGYHYEKDSTVICGCGVLVSDSDSNKNDTSTGARYVRLALPAGQTGWVNINEIEIYDQDGVRIQPVSIQANQGTDARKAIDGNQSTAWESDAEGKNVSALTKYAKTWQITADLGSNKKIGSVKFLTTYGNNAELLVSGDNQKFTKLESYTDLGNNDGSLGTKHYDWPLWHFYPKGANFSGDPEVTLTLSGVGYKDAQSATLNTSGNNSSDLGNSIAVLSWSSKNIDKAVFESDLQTVGYKGACRPINNYGFSGVESPMFSVFVNANKVIKPFVNTVFAGKTFVIDSPCNTGVARYIKYTGYQYKTGKKVTKTVTINTLKVRSGSPISGANLNDAGYYYSGNGYQRNVWTLTDGLYTSKLVGNETKFDSNGQSYKWYSWDYPLTGSSIFDFINLPSGVNTSSSIKSENECSSAIGACSRFAVSISGLSSLAPDYYVVRITPKGYTGEYKDIYYTDLPIIGGASESPKVLDNGPYKGE